MRTNQKRSVHVVMCAMLRATRSLMKARGDGRARLYEGRYNTLFEKKVPLLYNTVLSTLKEASSVETVCLIVS